MKFQTVIGAVCAALILLVFVDCATGHWDYYPAVVSGHQYNAPWTEFYIDSDGHQQTRHHPEEYHVYADVFDCEESAATYFAVKDGDKVTVSVRTGRFSGCHYMPRIVPLEK